MPVSPRWLTVVGEVVDLDAVVALADATAVWRAEECPSPRTDLFGPDGTGHWERGHDMDVRCTGCGSPRPTLTTTTEVAP